MKPKAKKARSLSQAEIENVSGGIILHLPLAIWGGRKAVKYARKGYNKYSKYFTR